MQRLELKPTHKPVQTYYSALRQFDDLGVTHETAVRSAVQGLLDHCARQHDWTLVPEWEIRRPRQHPLRVDGLFDNFHLTRGFRRAGGGVERRPLLTPELDAVVTDLLGCLCGKLLLSSRLNR